MVGCPCCLGETGVDPALTVASGDEVTTLSPASLEAEFCDGDRGDCGGRDVELSTDATAAASGETLLRRRSFLGGLAGEVEEEALEVPAS